MWHVEYTDQFGNWFERLSEDDQDMLVSRVEELMTQGPKLGRPSVDNVKQSRHANMKELRAGRALRALFAFDPRRTAILLIGGDKSSNDSTSPNWNRWYDTFVPYADRLYDAHLAALRSEGDI